MVRIAEGLGVATLLGAVAVFGWSLARPPAHPPGTLAVVSSLPASSGAPAPAVTQRPGRLASGGFASAVPKLIQARADVPGATLNQGLAGYWRFDEHTGARQARDASPLENDCSLHRLKAELGWTDAPVTGGRSLASGGWLDCKQPPLPASTGAEASAALWIRMDQIRVYHGTLVARQLVPGVEDLFYFGVQGHDLVLRSSVWQPNRLAASLVDPIGRWIHVAFTRRHDGVTRLYVNGAVVAEDHAQALPAGPTSGPLLVGAALRSGKKRDVIQHFYGAIDEVLVYDRALSDDEIATIAGGIAPTPDGRIAAAEIH